MKFIITPRSANPITGPMLVTTSPRASCPGTCAFKGRLCYAESGMLGGFIWSFLDHNPVGHATAHNLTVRSYAQLLHSIHSLPPKAIWRHNQAGDLEHVNGSIDAQSLDGIVHANRGRRGFTYTHHDVVINARNRALVADANAQGFTINLSGNNPEHADKLFDMRCGPVVSLVPASQRSNTRTPKGRKIVICPAVTRHRTCLDCQLCVRQRDFIVGFPAIGPHAHEVQPLPTASPKVTWRAWSWLRLAAGRLCRSTRLSKR